MWSYCSVRTDWSSLGLIHTVATKTAILEVSQTITDIIFCTLNSLSLAYTYIHTQTVKRKITLTLRLYSCTITLLRFELQLWKSNQEEDDIIILFLKMGFKRSTVLQTVLTVTPIEMLCPGCGFLHSSQNCEGEKSIYE